jgi:hypothetical protein
MDRQNINSGFKKRRVWQDAVSRYVMACQIVANFPFELKKVAANSIDAAHSIPRNISQGYLHYQIETARLKRIESLQKKQTEKLWQDRFHYTEVMRF